MKRDAEKNFDVFLMKDIETTLEDIFASGGTMTVYPKGTSMLPTIREGRDSVELSSVSEIKKNCIYLYKRPNGEFALHRLLKVENDLLIFCGDNQLVLERVKKKQLLAYASRIYRGKKEVSKKTCYRVFLFINSIWFFRRIGVKWRKLKKRFSKSG